jgi:hypothetical protein
LQSLEYLLVQKKNKIRLLADFLYTLTYLAYLANTLILPNMSQMSRTDFTDKVQEYIRRINQIAEEQGYSVMMSYYIGGDEATPDDFIIDWRNMSLNDNLYALSRWTQDVMNNFDEDEDEDRFGMRPSEF